MTLICVTRWSLGQELVCEEFAIKRLRANFLKVYNEYNILVGRDGHTVQNLWLCGFWPGYPHAHMYKVQFFLNNIDGADCLVQMSYKILTSSFVLIKICDGHCIFTVSSGA